MKKRLIYLDYAAATPLDERVLKAMRPYFTEQFYNPSATYAPALRVNQALESARSHVAHWLGARSSEIIFTAGGTEANNLAIHGVTRQFPDANMLVSSIEHESVLRPAQYYDYKKVKVDENGRLDLADLAAKLDDRTALVSIMYANNEIGAIQPIRQVSQLISQIRKDRQAKGNRLPLYFHTDACQVANYLDLHVARLGVDLLSLDGSKVYGPKQSGGLYVKAGTQLAPLVDGGGQERGLRSGTENIAGAVGFAAALDLAQQVRQAETERLQKLQTKFFDQLKGAIPDASINGSLKYRLPNNIHLTIPGHDNERLLIQLDEAGILAAAGSACSARDDEPSYVLEAIGRSEAEARSSLRFTMGRGTTAADIEQVVKSLSHLVKA